MDNIDIVDLAQETKKLSAQLVEGDPVTQEILSSTFKNFFNQLDITSNVENTLRNCKEKKPDVIFIDLDISEIDGIELVRKIYEINSKQIIVVLSGNQEIEQISKLIQLGIASFVQKPVDTKKAIELLSNITKIVAKKKTIETKTFSISLPVDIYEMVHDNAKSESVSKNAIIIRGLRDFYA